MKINIVAVTAYSDIAEAHLFTGMAKAGARVTVLCPEDAQHYTMMKKEGVEVYPLSLSRRFDKSGTEIIRRHLIEKEAHILHVFNNKAAINGIRAAKGLSVNIVAYRGVVGHVNFFNPYWWMTYLHPRVKRVVCVSEAIRQYFVNMSFCGFSLPQSKFVTIYKGHKLSWYPPQETNFSEFKIPENTFIVGTIANMRSHNSKGIPEFIESIRYIPDDIHFLIIGHMDFNQLSNQLNKNSRKSRIHFTGFRKDAATLVGGLDVYVQPSVKTEGLPKTVIEAMAHAIPPIVTNTGGSPELVVSSQSGIVVPPGNPQAIAEAIISLKNNSARRKTMGIAAQQRINDQFGNETTVIKTLELYQNLLSE